MKIPAIKSLVEKYGEEELMAAENAILEGEQPAIEIEGEDEGEKLTHISGALFIHDKMKSGLPFPVALREFTQKVRNSIS